MGRRATPELRSARCVKGWSAGAFGLYRYFGGSSIQQYDDVKIGYDNNADGDILDAGDDIQALDTPPAAQRPRLRGNRQPAVGAASQGQVDDDFGSNAMSLSYDNTLDLGSLRQGQASNLTDDGVYQFVYDPWNP